MNGIALYEIMVPLRLKRPGGADDEAAAALQGKIEELIDNDPDFSRIAEHVLLRRTRGGRIGLRRRKEDK